MRFAGEYQDTGSGLYNLRARSYDTATGRFGGLDPLAHGLGEGASSSYIYAGDNPTSFVDPSGMGQVHPNTCGGFGCFITQTAKGCLHSVACLVVTGFSLVDPLLLPEAEGLALADEMILVRGGLNTADRFEAGTGVTVDAEGNLWNVSVNAGRTVREAAAGIKNKQIGETTVGAVRRAGGVVRRDPSPGNFNHCLIGGLSAGALSSLFTPTEPNPCL
jgi:RHS repeat-associated protein